MNRFPIFITLIFTLLSAISCNADTVQPIQLRVPSGFGGSVNMGEALTVSAGGLASSEYPVILEALTKTGDVASRASLTADLDGNISDFILAYDMGLWDTPGDGRLSPGEYTIRLMSANGTSEASINVLSHPNHSTIWACDSDGKVTSGFEVGKPVFVTAKKLISGKKYHIWPIADRRTWSDGDTFKSWAMTQPGVNWPDDIPQYIEVEGDANGNLAPTQLLPYATKLVAGITDQFDIILDAAPFGVFNSLTDAVDGTLATGVVVQEPSNGGPRITELACRKNYVYTNIFYTPDSVYIWLNPGIMTTSPHAYVYKYVVRHTTNWVDGAAIADITGGAESDSVQFGCANEGLVLVWAQPTVGEYDALIDMNANGIYDADVDFLDGGPSGPGFKVVKQ